MTGSRIGETILVRALKHDGSESRSWPAYLLRKEGALVVLEATFDRDIKHDLLGTISRGTLSIEYYWLDRWYNVFRFLEPDGQLKKFYCNVNQPPLLECQTLSYVDMDIDVVVEPDFTFQVVDLDEFDLNARIYKYSPELQTNAHSALAQLIELIQTRAFPFDE